MGKNTRASYGIIYIIYILNLLDFLLLGWSFVWTIRTRPDSLRISSCPPLRRVCPFYLVSITRIRSSIENDNSLPIIIYIILAGEKLGACSYPSKDLHFICKSLSLSSTAFIMTCALGWGDFLWKHNRVLELWLLLSHVSRCVVRQVYSQKSLTRAGISNSYLFYLKILLW